MRARTALLAAVTACAASGLARADPVDDALAARCAREPRLDGAAALALADPQGFDAQELRARAQARGLRAPSVHALVLRGGDPVATGEAVSRWLAGRAVSPALSRCAVASGRGLLAVALAPRAVDVVDAPAGDGSRAWRVALPTGLDDVSLVATSPDGDVLRAPVAADGRASLPLGARSGWTLQVLAALPSGPAPLATWTEAAHAPAEGPSLWSTRQVLGAINATRREAGRAPLRRDPLLDAVAARHAERLAARGVIAHTPEPGDSPLDRLRAAGVATSRVAENLARGRTLTAAHEALTRSPSHRANLLDAEVDAVGLGVARASGEVYLVEVFAARPSLGARGE